MATIGNTVMTLADHAKTFGPDHKVARIIEMLAQRNGILDDIMFRMGNLSTGHRTTLRNGLPAVYWKNFNMGVPVSKSQKIQVDEKCGMLEAWSEVDEDLANLEADLNGFRLSEARAFIQAMGIEVASTIFYGNSGVDPEQFDGLTIRYSDPTAANGRNIINGGGSTASSQTSVWLITHGEDTFHGFFPKGSQAGLVHKNHGLKTIDSTGAGLGTNRMTVYQDQFKWHLGTTLRDWRYCVRICNLDTTGSLMSSLPELLIAANHAVEDLNVGKSVIYMNRTVIKELDLDRYAKAGLNGMTYKEIDGFLIPHFRGIPIKTCDAILNTESVVTGF